MKYRKQSVVIEAVQWFKMGDHPAVEQYRPSDWTDCCDACSFPYNRHGVVGRHIVCPNDWIIAEGQLTPYPCKPDVFEQTYEPVEGQR